MGVGGGGFGRDEGGTPIWGCPENQRLCSSNRGGPGPTEAGRCELLKRARSKSNWAVSLRRLDANKRMHLEYLINNNDYILK